MGEPLTPVAVRDWFGEGIDLAERMRALAQHYRALGGQPSVRPEAVAVDIELVLRQEWDPREET